MKIDTETMTVDGKTLYSKEAFEKLSDLWLKVGWQLRVPYTYSWLGFPILQLPDDMIRMQEVIFRLQPDVIVETGVAHGGSVFYYASLCKMIGHGHVIGVEKGLRCEREIRMSGMHEIAQRISLIEGDSTDPEIVKKVHESCYRHGKNPRVLVILDSDHSKLHVAKELEAYHDLIQSGFYIVAADGNMADLADVPRGSPEWKWNNPQEAAKEFANRHTEFVIEQPAWPFNESQLDKNITYLPSAWLRRN